MKVLLDTHAFLWFVLGDDRLSSRALAVIANPESEVLVSPATFWEIAIKVSLGKYALTEPIDRFMERTLSANRFSLHPIAPRHLAALSSLPFHHRDPFDRLLVATAIADELSLVAADIAFDAYDRTLGIW